MYKLRSTIKCPNEKRDEIVAKLQELDIKDYKVEVVAYEKFITESRLYWDYVFPEMKEDHKPVTYILFVFPDTQEGRKASHNAEWAIGWIPQNIRYVEVYK